MPQRRILIGGHAGLWARLRALVFAAAYAELSDRSVHVKWSDRNYSDDGTDVFFRYFEDGPLSPWPEDLDVAGIYPPAWAGFTDLSFLERRRMLEGGRAAVTELRLDLSEYAGDDETLVVFPRQVKRGRVMACLARLADARPDLPRRKAIAEGNYQSLVGEIALDYLRPRSDIRQAVDAFVRDQFGPTTIGVHIRYTDAMVNLAKVFSSLDAVLEREPDAVVFLATDSEPVRDMVTARYANVVTQDQSLAADSRALHLTRASPASRYELGRAAFIDLYLLAECDYLLYCTRGFARFATAISQRRPERSIVYHTASELIKRPSSKGGSGSPPTVSLLIPVAGGLPVAALRDLAEQDYPGLIEQVVLFGHADVELLCEMESELGALGFLDCSPDELGPALAAATGQVVILVDPERGHGPTWLRDQVRTLLATPLRALLYRADQSDGRPSEFCLLSAVLEDPAMAGEVADGLPGSPWGRRLEELGYSHARI